MPEVYREDVWFDPMGDRARDHRAIASHERPPKPTRVRAPRALRRPAMTPGDVLRHVMLNDPASALACADARGLRHLNEQMLTILEACHRVDTARRQLLNTLKAQKTLESVSHILAARVEAGLSECLEQRKLALRLADALRLKLPASAVRVLLQAATSIRHRSTVRRPRQPFITVSSHAACYGLRHPHNKRGRAGYHSALNTTKRGGRMEKYTQSVCEGLHHETGPYREP